MPDLTFYALSIVILTVVYQIFFHSQARVSPRQDIANMQGGPRRRPRRSYFFPPRAARQSETLPESAIQEMPKAIEYEPILKEVLSVKEELQRISNLPIELIEAIIDLAEYWPHTSTTLRTSKLVLSGNAHTESVFIIRSHPLGYTPTPDSREIQHTTYNIKPAWKLKTEAPKDCKEQIATQWKSDSFARGEHPCRKIVFTFRSHDQGMCPNHRLRGTYRESWTWFDVGKEELLAFKEEPSLPDGKGNENDCNYKNLTSDIKNLGLPYFECQIGKGAETESMFCVPQTTSFPLDSDVDQPVYGTIFKHELHAEEDKCIQKNKTATLNTQQHVVTWKYNDNITDPNSMEGKELDDMGRGRETGNGDFVRGLKIGDSVAIWAKARFGGWYNSVEFVQMKVFWAV